MLNAQALRSLFCIKLSVAEKWQPHLAASADYAEINTDQRLACYLAQLGHESGNLRYVREVYGPTAQQLRYEPGTTLAKRLGNTQVGDGKLFMGRGLIQVTGRSNYAIAGKQMKLDLLAHPELLELPEHAAISAAMYWKRRKLNRFADSYDFAGLTKAINGGITGLAHRQALYTKATTLCSKFSQPS